VHVLMSTIVVFGFDEQKLSKQIITSCGHKTDNSCRSMHSFAKIVPGKTYYKIPRVG
jgi:hypothetical protein